MSASDKFLDFAFMLFKEWVDVFLEEDASALGLREDKICQEEKTDPAVEGEPDNLR